MEKIPTIESPLDKYEISHPLYYPLWLAFSIAPNCISAISNHPDINTEPPANYNNAQSICHSFEKIILSLTNLKTAANINKQTDDLAFKHGKYLKQICDEFHGLLERPLLPDAQNNPYLHCLGDNSKFISTICTTCYMPGEHAHTALLSDIVSFPESKLKTHASQNNASPSIDQNFYCTVFDELILISTLQNKTIDLFITPTNYFEQFCASELHCPQSFKFVNDLCNYYKYQPGAVLSLYENIQA